MNDTDRLLGALGEFKADTHRRLDKIEGKIDELHAFKWKVTGMAMTGSFILTLLVQAFKGRF